MSLRELRVRGLAVLAEVRIAPGPGLTVLTGETGSGKSLCIGALRLAVGGRVEGDLLRAGVEAGAVAAVFDEIPQCTRARLEAHGVAVDDLLTLSRELPRAARGACRINGALVSLAMLREVGEELVEITAQGESHRLLRPARQRALVDAHGGAPLAEARGAMAAAMRRLGHAEQALDAARRGQASDAAALQDALAVVAELTPLGLCAGEDHRLAAERQRLRHLAALTTAAEALRGACGGADDGQGAADLVAAALTAAPGVAGLDAALDALRVEASDVVQRLRELAAAARALAESLELDTDRLRCVEERLDILERVKRRHGGSLDAALGELAAAQSVVAAGDGGARRLAGLETEAASARADAGAAAARLSRLRGVAASRLERAVTAEVRRLRLPHARFRAVLGRLPQADGLEVEGELLAAGPEGVDSVDFRLATAAGAVPLPLGEVASGGELSRLALALRAVVADADDCPTLVLDEVDTGLGGETAARVGAVLAEAGRRRQLLVVTHRAEIAARADTHLVVSRGEATDAAQATVAAVVGEQRVEEVARLLSGRTTQAALARATELLAEAAGDAAAVCGVADR